MHQITQAVAEQLEKGVTFRHLVGFLDDPKIRSSLRLFERISRESGDAELNAACVRAMKLLKEEPEISLAWPPARDVPSSPEPALGGERTDEQSASSDTRPNAGAEGPDATTTTTTAGPAARVTTTPARDIHRASPSLDVAFSPPPPLIPASPEPLSSPGPTSRTSPEPMRMSLQQSPSPEPPVSESISMSSLNPASPPVLVAPPPSPPESLQMSLDPNAAPVAPPSSQPEEAQSPGPCGCCGCGGGENPAPQQE